MKILHVPAFLTLLLCLSAPAAPPDQQSVKPARIPSRWFDKAKDYPKALELQKETGADLFVYFSRMVPSDQKGLCKWFEKKGLGVGPVSRMLRDYVKVKITLPSNDEDEKLAKDFRVGHCPMVYIVRPDGWKTSCKPFDWPGGKPELKDPEDLVEMFRAASSPPEAAAGNGEPENNPE